MTLIIKLDQKNYLPQKILNISFHESMNYTIAVNLNVIKYEVKKMFSIILLLFLKMNFKRPPILWNLIFILSTVNFSGLCTNFPHIMQNFWMSLFPILEMLFFSSFVKNGQNILINALCLPEWPRGLQRKSILFAPKHVLRTL